MSSSFHKYADNLDFKDMNYTFKKYDMMQAYCESKLYCLLLVSALNYVIHVKGDDKIIKAVGLNPGVVNTDLYKYRESKRPG